MKKRSSLLWILVILAMLAVVLYFMFKKQENFNWSQTLRPEGNEPYDLDVFYTLLKENKRGADFTELTKTFDVEFEDLDAGKTYTLFAVDYHFYPDTNELRALESFVKNGNTLFISANSISPLLPVALAFGTDSVLQLYHHITTEDLYSNVPDTVTALYDEAETWEQKDSIHRAYQAAVEENVWKNGFLDSAFFGIRAEISLVETQQKIPLMHIFPYDTAQIYWYGIQLPGNQTGKNLAVYQDQKPAIVQWQVGNGSVIIAATPLLFTNYYMLKKEYFQFNNALMAQLPAGDFLFDNVQRYNRDIFTPKAELSQSPLTYILKQPALTWAWYTLLIATLLFVVFRSKRKQRIIPILKPNLNTTLAYAKMLGSLQLKEKNNAEKASEIMQHFLQQLRSRNRWNSNQMDDDFKNMLLKLVPDLNREIQIILHLASKANKNLELTDQEIVNLFNYTKRILDRL